MKILLIFVLLLQGCATLTNGPISKIVINTDPPDATVTTDSGETKTSPCVFRFSNHKEQKINIEKEGYEKYSNIIAKRFLKRFWWNILFLPGMVIDLGTGSAWRLEPNKYDITLRKK